MVVSERETVKEEVRQDARLTVRQLLEARRRAIPFYHSSYQVPLGYRGGNVNPPGMTWGGQTHNTDGSAAAIREEPNILRSTLSISSERNTNRSSSSYQLPEHSSSAVLLPRILLSGRQNAGEASSSQVVQAPQDREGQVQRNRPFNRFRSLADPLDQRLAHQALASLDPDIPAYQYLPSSFNPSELTFRQACTVMATFDYDRYGNKIKDTIRKYSLRIYGLEDCSLEDLRIAVYLFIDDKFSFQPAIELCVRHISDAKDPNVVGVLFERTATRSRILDNRSVLKDTRYRVARNDDIGWIIWNYDD